MKHAFLQKSFNKASLVLLQQVEELNPPENPAKLTDSRAAEYIRQYGESSWELDAIEPSALADLVRKAVIALRDPERWKDMVIMENSQRARMDDLIANMET